MTESNRRFVLETAGQAVNGSRNEDYGEPFDDFSRVAQLWTAAFDKLFAPEDVAKALILLKIGRLCETPGHVDSWVDIAGYAACGFDAHEDGKEMG